MRTSNKTKYHEQWPNRGFWETGNAIAPSYLTIGGSGIVGNGGPESPMTGYEDSDSQTYIDEAGPSTATGAGSAAGAGITGAAGSGVA